MKAEYDFRGGKRGPLLKAPAGKIRITIRLDEDLLNWFRKQAHADGGGSYQTLINAALREYVVTKREPLEATLRRVLREELPARQGGRELAGFRSPAGRYADFTRPRNRARSRPKGDSPGRFGTEGLVVQSSRPDQKRSSTIADMVDF